MWTWKRPRLSAFGCNGRFAWANKSSHELFICASIREKIWLWLPDSSVLWALWGGSSWFQSVSAWAFHPVVKTMCVDESHSPRGDPWKTCSVKRKSFYSILAGERLNRSTLSHHQHPCCGNTAVNFNCGSAGLSSALRISCLVSTFLAFKVHYWQSAVKENIEPVCAGHPGLYIPIVRSIHYCCNKSTGEQSTW